jgi:hypothetical protein
MMMIAVHFVLRGVCARLSSAVCDVLLQVFSGVCTTYMQQLACGSTIDVLVRVSKFKLPKQLNCPVIMIGQYLCLQPRPFF